MTTRLNPFRLAVSVLLIGLVPLIGLALRRIEQRKHDHPDLAVADRPPAVARASGAESSAFAGSAPARTFIAKSAAPAASSPAPAVLAGQAAGPHPRLLLTPERLARAQRNRTQKTVAWRALSKACEEASAVPARSGYEGWDWGNYMADCALVWHITQDAGAARAALKYLVALTDDRERIGDGEGGDRAARHDHGYAIRTYGFYSALGYDWLHDAPGMTEALRSQIRARLNTWLSWYAESGYRRDAPVSNYFMGYFATLAYTALATSKENETDWTPVLDHLFATRVKPAYAKLMGGDWPEGWQYGDGAATMMALFVDGERTARNHDRLSELPWLPAVVAHHTHALLPDGMGAYDNGDWTARPPKMPSRALDALTLALPANGDLAKKARFLARQLRNSGDEWRWLVPLTDDAAAPTLDPRGVVKSYLAAGTGLVLARSSWDRDAVFVSLQSGPSFADADHQHADQGHFEVSRGKDALFIDPGDYSGFATVNHNALLVDDHRDALDYCPNQGIWGRDSHVAAFVDTGEYVYVRGDIGDAYRPSKLEYGTKRSVLAVTRDWLFVRPSTLLLFDRVEVAKPDYGIAWVGHTSVRPELRGNELRASVGSSRMQMSMLLPEHPSVRILAEPTNSDASPFVANRVYGTSFRVEIAAKAEAGVRFLNVVRATNIAEPSALDASLLPADGGVAAAIASARGPAIVAIFASDSKVRITGPSNARVLVVGLSANGVYGLRTEAVDDGCRIVVASPAAPDEARKPDEAGTIAWDLRGCQAHAGDL